MKIRNFLPAILLIFSSLYTQSQTPARVDYDAFEKLTKEVKEHRKTRLVSAAEFLRLSKEEKVIILDARSDAMYAAKHIKGAVHLNFSDFTQTNLAKVIPDMSTKILIYCNNNIDNDEVYFPTKSAAPAKSVKTTSKPLTLALNIPTYINLYGYGYKNVYELAELVSGSGKTIEFEGTAVKQ